MYLEKPLPDTERLEEKVILVGITLPKAPRRCTQQLEELERLAATVGAVVVGKMVQNRAGFHPATYIGSGKVEELKHAAQELQANLIIFDDDLSPAQARNLEKILKIRVIDRTELILDIFALHAKTGEAKLQVELAQLEYALPRLKRLWEHLDRYRGGIGTRGPGEKQLESDRRLIKKRIRDLSTNLKNTQKRKQREVRSRKEKFFTVGLVGYTNAGKSTLMNALTNADVLVEDKLFATLDTRTRSWEVGGRTILLSDTVGFIEKLPHHLVASFKATLEEAAQADLLLHVVDVSHPDAEHHVQVVNDVLKSINLHEKPCLLVFNKIDLLADSADLTYLGGLYPEHIVISARHARNLELLHDKVLAQQEATMLDLHIVVPIADGKLQAWVEEHARILDKQSNERELQYRLRLPCHYANWLLEQEGVAPIIASDSSMSVL